MGPRCRGALGLYLAVLCALGGAAVPAEAQPAARPQLSATRALTTPSIDGVLDDEAWQGDPLPSGEWLTYSPLNGDRIPQTTTVWLAYDDDYLYFAFKCDDPEPAAIKTSVTRRDNAFPDDWVAISLDALGTGQLSYHMFINPNGIQMDALNSSAGNEDFSPDWLWDSAGRRTETGYAVEVRLPMQSIRFKGGRDQRMGIMFFRRVSRLGKSVSWPPMPAGQWVFEHHASVMFEQIQSRRVREVLPSVTFSRRQTRETPRRWEPADNTADIGFSAKLGLTPTVTLDATVNPDFSQVESDAFQAEVNRRFPIFYSEKRPFFMEGTGVFAMAGGGDSSLQTAVHTRRIVDPSFGAKLTGSIDRVTFGALSALDTFGDHDRLFNIGRLQYSIGPNNYIGALLTDTTSSVAHNSVVGADFKWRVSPTQRIEGLAMFSRSTVAESDGAKTGAAARGSYSFETEKWFVLGKAEHFDPGFDMATAFIDRVALTSGAFFVNRSFYPDKKRFGWLPRLGLVSFTRVGEDRVAGGRELFTADGVQLNLTRQGFVRVQHQYGFERWVGRRFRTGGPSAFGGIQLFRWLSVNGGISSGPAVYYDRENPFQGHNFGLGLGFTFQPSGRLSQEIGIDHTAFDRDDTRERVFTVDILNTKTTYQFTRAFSLRGIVQYDSLHRRVLTDFLSSYEPHPGTVVYAGYGSLIEQRAFIDGQWVPLSGDYRATTRGLFLKASYLHRF